MADSKASVLVYKIYDYGSAFAHLVFALEKRALFIDQILRAINNSATVGELRRNLPAGEWEEMVETNRESYEEDEGEFEIPKDDEKFRSAWVPGLEAGDYPPWLEQEMLNWFPRDIAWRFGKMESSRLNGSFLFLPKSAEKEIVDALKQEGFEVERRDELLLWG